MKQFIKFFLNSFIVVMCLFVVSCSNDDDSAEAQNPLIGTWDECDSSGHLETDEQHHYTFNKNNTGEWSITEDGHYDDGGTFTYTYSGNSEGGKLVMGDYKAIVSFNTINSLVIAKFDFTYSDGDVIYCVQKW